MNLLSRRRALLMNLKKILKKVFGIPPLVLEDTNGENAVGYNINGNSIQGDSLNIHNLPSEYREIAYIESTGTQYIDTGVIPTNTTGFDIIFLTKNEVAGDGTGYGSIFGAREGSKQNELQLTTYTADTTMSSGTLRFGNTDNNAGITANIKTHSTLLNNAYTNNVDVNYTLEETSFTSPVSLTVFALNNNGTITQHGKMQLYSLKIYDGETLIRDYVPCYRFADNVLGLYDLVEGTFYTNKGTGTFIKGGFTPTPEIPIEVESVGEKTNNLFDVEYMRSTSNYTITIAGGYRGVALELKPNTTYTFNSKRTEKTDTPTSSFWYKVGNVYNSSAGSHIGSYNASNGSYYFGKVSITTGDDGMLYVMYAGGLNNVYEYFTDFQLVEDTKLPKYEPYGYKIPVVAQGKNLFDINNTENWVRSNYHYYPIDIGANKTVTVSLGNDLTGEKGLYLCVGTKRSEMGNGNAGGGKWIYLNNATKAKSVTVKADAEGYIYINMAPKDLSKLTLLQVEYGSTATEFESYQEPITTNIYLDKPLSKINDYADYVDFANGTVVRNIEQVYVSKVDARSGVTTNEYCVFLSNVNKKPYLEGSAGKSKGFAISNKFKQSDVVYNDLYNYPNLIQGYITTGGAYRLAYSIGDTTVRTVEAAQAVIGSGFEAYYVLETPTEEFIEFPQLPTLKGTTVYTVDTSIQPSNMEISYYS